jgi:2-polyprenyl-6-methoxyphenol hydroxylase-like FAD-dependent oxidoreductase/lipid II:glycine glycyltransferase (peptidoglycan interpeptide bridge formation enzyme)
MKTRTNPSVKVIVVGAGLAGTAVAAVLGQQGRRVILVDPRPSYPPVFKAEKIDQEQVYLLRKLGLLGHLLQYSGQVREVRVGYDGRIIKTVRIEQYGITYADMVNALRAHLPGGVECQLGRVEDIANSSDIQRVRLTGGEELTSRLVVMACGSSPRLEAQLRLRRRMIQKNQSFVFGFTIAPLASRPFDFDSVTYYSLEPSARIDYLTLFKIRQTMRANLFVFRPATDPWVREFILEPEQMLRRHLPKLGRVTGDFRIISKIESGGADLYRMDGDPPPGVVMIGDAFQSVCPSTGMGLDKILTDVDVLSECVPDWLSTPGMGCGKLADFYNHPRKLATDSRALHRAINQRRASTNTALPWRVKRLLRHMRWHALGAINGGVAKENHVPKPGTADQALPAPEVEVAMRGVLREGPQTARSGKSTHFGAHRLEGLRPCEIPGLGQGMSVEAGSASPKEWAVILQKFCDANLYQTWPYSSARWGGKRLGHVILRRRNELVAAAQVIVMKVPLSPVGLAYVKWGPLWQARGQAALASTLRDMLISLRGIYVRQERMLLRVTPWEFENDEQRAVIREAGFKENLAAERLRTAALDLSHSMEQLRASLSRHWRHNLNLAEKNELEVGEGFTDDLMNDFLALYKDMRRRKGKTKIPPLDYLPQVQRQLPEGLKLRITICRHAGVPVAGLVVSAMGSKAFAVAAASGTSGMDLRGSYLVQWRMIRWLKDHNIRWYDLARINEKTHPGTTQFKLGLSGKLGSTVEYLGEFQVCESRASHLLVRAAEGLRSTRWKIWNAIHDRALPWRDATSHPTKPVPTLQAYAAGNKMEESAMPNTAVRGTTAGLSRVALVEDLRSRVATALNISPALVNIEGHCIRYMGLFLQCWGTAAGARVFAKVFLVDRYPTPPRFATPAEELATPENPNRPVEGQIEIERNQFRQMRALMGSQNIPTLLGCSLSHRILVYEEVNGLRVDSLVMDRLANWFRVRDRNGKSVATALFGAGAWLRALHDSTSEGFESIESGKVIEDLRALVRKKQMETSPYAALALKALEFTPLELGAKACVRVPVALSHGDFTLPNLLWNDDHHHLWVIDFELSAVRPILHDLCTMIFDLRKHLLHPLTSPQAIELFEKAFWKGYGAIPDNLLAFTNALATTRLFYHTLPKLRDWREQRGLWAGIKASLYNRVFEPVLVRHLLTILSEPDSGRRSHKPAAERRATV